MILTFNGFDDLMEALMEVNGLLCNMMRKQAL